MKLKNKTHNKPKNHIAKLQVCTNSFKSGAINTLPDIMC